MVDGYTAALRNIRAPMFVGGTERNHVAPWRSVCKIHRFTDTNVTFVLTSGGHNAGIVSEPGHPHRRSAPPKDGSWWVDWAEWLAGHSDTERIGPTTMGTAIKSYAPIIEAPGTYVPR